MSPAYATLARRGKVDVCEARNALGFSGFRRTRNNLQPTPGRRFALFGRRRERLSQRPGNARDGDRDLAAGGGKVVLGGFEGKLCPGTMRDGDRGAAAPWPSALVTKARNCWATSGLSEDFSTPPPEMETKPRPGSLAPKQRVRELVRALADSVAKPATGSTGGLRKCNFCIPIEPLVGSKKRLLLTTTLPYAMTGGGGWSLP